jgi:hypothetical protein
MRNETCWDRSQVSTGSESFQFGLILGCGVQKAQLYHVLTALGFDGADLTREGSGFFAFCTQASSPARSL